MASDTPDNFDLMAVLSRTVDSEPLVMPCEEQCSLNTDNTSLEHTKTVDSVFAWPAILLMTSHKFGGLTTEKFIEFFCVIAAPEVFI
ncbi:uncharacterized protein OCT59_014041 [Rhizophagus irregularis]|uniref:uncharacterized protein n=1 Tax=Rhizophagus irregularis TaxID=588596 RepID=UPI00332391AA|nr:hypothetical protein OCT59_014041 [Rhizophagus irregularis]